MDKNFSTRSKNSSYENMETQTVVSTDEGLRAYMLGIYNYMTIGLGITGLVAFFTASSQQMLYALYSPPLSWVVMLAPLGFVFFLSARINRIQASTAQLLFWVFSAVMGLSLAFIFIEFTQTSIARVFFITAGTFAGMSLYGYTTGRDLTGIGSFMFMGLIGLILASIVNLFLGSGALDFAISVIGVLVFIGLTAYDTQKIKLAYDGNVDGETASKKSIMGALTLYLDFLNLFLFLLRLLGSRR